MINDGEHFIIPIFTFGDTVVKSENIYSIGGLNNPLVSLVSKDFGFQLVTNKTMFPDLIKTRLPIGFEVICCDREYKLSGFDKLVYIIKEATLHRHQHIKIDDKAGYFLSDFKLDCPVEVRGPYNSTGEVQTIQFREVETEQNAGRKILLSGGEMVIEGSERVIKYESGEIFISKETPLGSLVIRRQVEDG